MTYSEKSYKKDSAVMESLKAAGIDEEKLAMLMDAGVDAGSACKRLMGRGDLFVKYAKRFIEEPWFDRLARAFDEGDASAAFTAAHTLRGSVGYVGAESMYEILVDMTEELRSCSSHSLENQRKAFEKLKNIRSSVVAAFSAL